MSSLLPLRTCTSVRSLLYLLCVCLVTTLQGATSYIVTNVNNSGNGSLRDAIEANNDSGGGGLITFDLTTPARIFLNGQDLDILEDLTIEGPGANQLAIDGNQLSRIFRLGNRAEVVIKDISIENGKAFRNQNSGYGGGIFLGNNSRASLELEGVSIRNNVSTYEGGGIAVASGSLSIFRSSLVGNSADERGGAIYANYGDEVSVVIDTSTIADNWAPFGTGGTITNERILEMDSVALVNNSSPTLIVEGPGSATFRNSIFQDGGEEPTFFRIVNNGIVTSQGYNLFNGDPDIPLQTGDQIVEDINLDDLALNGGSTLSPAPLPGSPAINQGSTAAPAPPVDQPGFTRVRGGAIDVGPVEVQNDAPEILCLDPIDVGCTSASGAEVSIRVDVRDLDSDEVTVSWIYDGDKVAISTVTTNGDAFVPVSETISLPFGDSIVTVEVSDEYLSSGPCDIEVNVSDIVAPEVTLIGEETITLECGDSYEDEGATATDTCDTELDVVVKSSTLPADTSALEAGIYTIVYSATDASENEGTVTRTIQVLDTKEPKIVPPADISIRTSSVEDACTVSVDFAAEVTDCSSLESVVYTIESIDGLILEVAELITSPHDFSPGTYGIQVRATDASDNSDTATFIVDIVDNTLPQITLNGLAEEILECGPDQEWDDASATATDNCSESLPVTTTFFLGEAEVSGIDPMTLGTYTVIYTVIDNYGNMNEATRTITVEDTTPPDLSLNGLAALTLECGQPYGELGAQAIDACDGAVAVTISNNFPEAEFLPVGEYRVTYTAEDLSGNTKVDTRTVSVEDTTGPVFESVFFNDTQVSLTILEEGIEGFVEISTDNGLCSSFQDFFIQAVDACDSEAPVFTYRILPNEVFPETDESPGGVDLFEPSFNFPYRTGGITYDLEVTATDSNGNMSVLYVIVTVTDPNNNCINNTSWPNALPLVITDAEEESVTSFGDIQQFLALTDQARWFRFSVQPGSRVTVVLTELTENYDLVVYNDISAEYQRLLDLFNSGNSEDEELSLLGVEFAPEAFSPEAFSPEAFSPEAFSPEAFSPEAFSPEAFSPEAFSPEAFSPEAFSPEAFSPEAFSPEAFSPEAFSPEAFSPEAFSPEAFSPEAFSPEAFSPEAFSPESFSSAQVSSVIAYSAFPGVASEGISINTFNSSGEFYVRVRGSNGVFDPDNPFSLSVFIESELCEGVEGAGSLGTSTLPPPPSGSFDTIIVWDSTRTDGDSGLLRSKLTELAASPLANGVIVDVSTEQRVVNANAQADANPACPFAKNLVAEEIKAIIDAYRAVNSGIEYVVLIGNDEAIPFFRTSDDAFLANEANFVPPVRDNTASQASLRTGQILTQDKFGAACIVNLSTGPFPYPDIPVGRMVESVEDIIGQIDIFLDNNGIIVASTAVVTGYDFLDDAALAIQGELEAALEGPIDTLIVSQDTPPSLGWTADDLADIFLGSRHEINFLAGHFSDAGALAADYKTRLAAAEVLASPVDLANTLIYSVGCHSGYNTVNVHAINGVTDQPDWAQAFGEKGAIFIAGTGYQYGDTEFIEYSERLYLEFTRQLRTGPEAVSIGKALVNAKREYLTETPLMRGIHEKSLLQATLFGLPMVKVEFPGARLNSTPLGTDLNVVPASIAVAGPGQTLGLQTDDVTINPQLTKQTLLLDVEGTEDQVTAEWFEGRNGRFVTSPAEPTRALEVYFASVNNTLLRGIGFRGGSYQDFDNFLPLTGAPATEIRGVYGNFISEVFYPVQPYDVSYLGTICDGVAGERINVYPTQYRNLNTGLGGGTLRRFGSMDFRLYYNNNRTTYTYSYFDEKGNKVFYDVIPALAPPPTIAQVNSSVEDGEVTFRINALGNPGAGIHEVWVTYTAVNPSSSTGQWVSLDLSQDTTDSTLWKGNLSLDGLSADEICFMVQAASGTGLVTLNSNRGFYYKLGLDGASGQPTRIPTQAQFIDPVPASGEYGETGTVSALFTELESGNPLVGKAVGIRLGTARALGVTDGNGLVTLQVPLKIPPSNNLLLQAYFQGDNTFKGSSVSSSFDLDKQDTTLAFIDPPAADQPVFGDEIIVKLSDVNGIPLKERTIFFLVDYGGTQLGEAVITDFSGRADLSGIELPPGATTITAYFNDIILPGGESVRITDQLYNPVPSDSAVGISATIASQELTMDFDPKKIDIKYASKKSKGKKTPPALYSTTKVEGELIFPEPIALSELQNAAKNPKLVTATIEAILAGEVIALETVQLEVFRNQNKYWKLAKKSGEASKKVRIYWNKGKNTPFEKGRFILDLKAIGEMAKPESDALPNQFEFRFVLGDEGAKQYIAVGKFGDGPGFTPWTKEKSSYKQFRQ